jgi:hypothetical protein
MESNLGKSSYGSSPLQLHNNFFLNPWLQVQTQSHISKSYISSKVLCKIYCVAASGDILNYQHQFGHGPFFYMWATGSLMKMYSWPLFFLFVQMHLVHFFFKKIKSTAHYVNWSLFQGGLIIACEGGETV